MREAPRVLVVDDDESIRLVARASLERLGGFSVRCADSGEAALNVLCEEDFDLILLDVVMGGMDGRATASSVRLMPRMADIPILFFTARVMPHERVGLFEAGATGLVEKPFDPVGLCSEVNLALTGVRHDASGGAPGDGRLRFAGFWREASVQADGDLGTIESWCEHQSADDGSALDAAWRASHRLAGLLGTFGYTTAGDVAGRLSVLLRGASDDPDTGERARGMVAEIRRLADLAV